MLTEYTRTWFGYATYNLIVKRNIATINATTDCLPNTENETGPFCFVLVYRVNNAVETSGLAGDFLTGRVNIAGLTFCKISRVIMLFNGFFLVSKTHIEK